MRRCSDVESDGIAEHHLFNADAAVFLRVEHAETELKPGFEFAKVKEEARGGVRLQLIDGLRGGMKYIERGEELGEVDLVVLDSTSATQTQTRARVKDTNFVSVE